MERQANVLKVNKGVDGSCFLGVGCSYDSYEAEGLGANLGSSNQLSISSAMQAKLPPHGSQLPLVRNGSVERALIRADQLPRGHHPQACT